MEEGESGTSFVGDEGSIIGASVVPVWVGDCTVGSFSFEG